MPKNMSEINSTNGTGVELVRFTNPGLIYEKAHEYLDYIYSFFLVYIQL